MNTVILKGNVGNDPELKQVNDTQVVKFSLATSESYKEKNGEKQTVTDWHNIIFWGKQAESCNQFLSKGRQVYIEGRLHSRSWEGQDGKARFSLEVSAERVLFLGKASVASFPEEGEIEPGDLSFD